MYSISNLSAVPPSSWIILPVQEFVDFFTGDDGQISEGIPEPWFQVEGDIAEKVPPCTYQCKKLG